MIDKEPKKETVDVRMTESKGIEGGTPDATSRGLAEKVKDEGQPVVDKDKSEAATAKKTLPEPTPPTVKGKLYADWGIEVYNYFNIRKTPYDNQLEPVTDPKKEVHRRSNFLTDDSGCDCAKFVLKALLDADNVDYYKARWENEKVPAFGDKELMNLTSTGGMLLKIGELLDSGKANPVRSDNPKVGDLLFWDSAGAKRPGHVALVTSVKLNKDKTDYLVSFVAKGNTAGATYAKDEPLSGGFSKYAKGPFRGFWTPCQ